MHGSHTSRLHVSTVPEQGAAVAEGESERPFPVLRDDGVYEITNKQEHQAFLEANQDKLVVLKVFAPWCRACKGLAPKYLSVVRDEKYKKLPIVWAQLTIQHNKDFVKSIGVVALPTIQFYIGGAISDTFPCGPSKFPILKKKLAQLVNANVDPTTFQVKQSSIDEARKSTAVEEPDAQSQTTGTTAQSTVSDASSTSSLPPPVPYNQTATAESKPAWITTSNDIATSKQLISDAERRTFAANIPFFSQMSLADLDMVMDKARLLTFEAGSVIMREGKPGHTFYIIHQGEVEICQRSYAEDPLQTSGNYLGTVVNRLEVGDYFGERALVTGEPRAASIRAAETTSCYAFDQSDFPLSSALSGRSRNTNSENLVDFNDKYGLEVSGLYAQEIQQQLRDVNVASQIRGSVNNPKIIKGVDTDDDIDEDDFEVESPPQELQPVVKEKQEDAVFNVLRRFQMIRQLDKVFNYIELTGAKWGDVGVRRRRSILVNRLTTWQQEEVEQTFALIDRDHDGYVTFAELKLALDSVLDFKTDDELMGMMNQNESVDNLPVLTKDDFMGIMAEAQFYYLFRDIFKALDPEDSGFVKAGELDRVLCGVRDLVSADRNSIIDVDDKEMLVDYEQFSRMLLG